MREFLWYEGEDSIAQDLGRLLVSEMKSNGIVFIGKAMLKCMITTLHEWKGPPCMDLYRRMEGPIPLGFGS